MLYACPALDRLTNFAPCQYHRNVLAHLGIRIFDKRIFPWFLKNLLTINQLVCLIHIRISV